jgi:multidrug efflux pump subunit AcrB
MEAYEATQDVSDSYSKGKLRFDFELLPEGKAMGLTPEEVGQQLRDAFFGRDALRQLRGTNEIKVRVKLPDNERRELYNLANFMIRLPNGGEVPLMEVANVSQEEAFGSIDRRGGRRIVTVGMDVEPQSATTRIFKVMQQQELPKLRQEFPGLTWTFEGSQAEMRESTQALWSGFAMAMLVIYSLLAVAFRSYIQPLIVMFSIPFGVIGAVFGHLLLGYDLSIVSLMGIVALSGVVVNGALIMVDYANKKRPDMPALAAIHEAGVRRFRPVFLTTLTTFGGLTPIILETSRQAYHLIPMAISLGFGIVFATAIMLVIVPCLYMAVEDLKTWKI